MELRTDRFKFKKIFPERVKQYAQKLHRKADEIELVRKGIPIDPKDIDINEGERAAIRLVTTPHLDRDSEILLPKGAILDDFKQAPTVLYAHDYKGLPIGSDKWVKVTNEGILAKTFYANHQFAEDIYQCVKDGHLRSNSVGFIPVEAVTPEDKKLFAETQEVLEKDYGISKDESGKAKNIYTKWIMLEHSDVPVASNVQSLNLAVAKGELNIQSERLKKDLEIEVVKNKDRAIEIIKEKANEDEANYAKLKEYTEEVPKKDRKIEVEKELEKSITDWTVLKEGNKTEQIIKPETTDKYHHIPVNPTCEITATMTISAEKGIKATYCGKVKKIHTYLFDVKKWTMEEARAWVKENHKRLFEDASIKEPEYKERWNKSLSKLFDIAEAESPEPLSFNFDLFEKFLECKIKNVFLNTYSIPCPLTGTYLAGFKAILSEFKLKDTRSFNWRGEEYPPQHEVIQLNSEKSDDFLIEGMNFYDAESKPLIVKYSPNWDGLSVSFITSSINKEWNKELMDKVHDWVQENNFLRGEKFALCGEFLKEQKEDWEGLVLESKYKDSIKKSVDMLEKKKEDMVGRGLLFIGPPGTGKTKTGRVLMTNMDSTFIWVSSRDFRNVGPLRAITLSYSLARDLAPSVLFIEDIDTWLKDYGDRDSVVVDLIKTEMDGLRQNKGILTIMTSNYPEKLPDALLDRPGRFHHIINYELPTDEQRKAMLELWAGEIETKLLERIVEHTDKFSGAHIKELVEFAKMIADEDEIEIGEALLKSLEKLTEQRELIEQIRENKTDSKEFWGKVKWVDGNIEVKKDKEISVEKLKEYDEKIKKLQKECEHEWIDVTCKDEKYVKEYTCPECGITKTEKILPSINELVAREAIEEIREMRKELAELKEGRVLSTKNRTLVKDTIEALTALKEKLEELYSATEPPAREEERSLKQEKEVVLEKDAKPADMEEKLTEAIEKLLSGNKLGELMNKSINEAIDIGIKKKLGRVE